MSTKAHVQTQATRPTPATAARIPQPPVALLDPESDRPDITAQLDGAARLGHSLGAFSVDGSAPPIIQRQELPEEDEEELQLKREPAAIQRQELPEEEEEELQMKPESAALQRQGRGEGFRLDDETASRINRARAGGQPLDGAIQAQMGEMMGHDFSGVRVHTDSEADALNQRLTAKAFTMGQDIFFRRAEYSPGSSSGRELIAHELTHVVQQISGRVSGAGSGITVRPDGDAFEQEADRAPQRSVTAQGSRYGSDNTVTRSQGRCWIQTQENSRDSERSNLLNIGVANQSNSIQLAPDGVREQLEGKEGRVTVDNLVVHDAKQVRDAFEGDIHLVTAPAFLVRFQAGRDQVGRWYTWQSGVGTVKKTNIELIRDHLAVLKAWQQTFEFVVAYETSGCKALRGIVASQGAGAEYYSGGEVQWYIPERVGAVKWVVRRADGGWVEDKPGP